MSNIACRKSLFSTTIPPAIAARSCWIVRRLSAGVFYRSRRQAADLVRALRRWIVERPLFPSDLHSANQSPFSFRGLRNQCIHLGLLPSVVAWKPHPHDESVGHGE